MCLPPRSLLCYGTENSAKNAPKHLIFTQKNLENFWAGGTVPQLHLDSGYTTDPLKIFVHFLVCCQSFIETKVFASSLASALFISIFIT